MWWLLMAACGSDPDGDGFSVDDGDCDDVQADIHPGAPEVCDGVDQDCNGQIDDSPTDGETYYVDDDGDGSGDAQRSVVACAKPDGHALDGDDCDDGDAALHPGATDTPDQDRNCDGEIVVTGDCPWVGTWRLEQLQCGTFDYAEWFEDHDEATLETTHDAAGGCAVTATISGASCTRTEGWHFSLPVGVEVAARFDGVESCVPASCAFGPTDPDACAEGALAGSATVRIEESVAGAELTAAGLLASTAADCSLDLLTVWARE